MNKYDEELLKNSPSMIKGIAVEVDKLNGGQHLALTVDDVRGMAEFGLALGGQISEADKVSTEKLTIECIIGGALFGCLAALFAANLVNKKATRDTPMPINSITCVLQHRNKCQTGRIGADVLYSAKPFDKLLF